MLKRSNKPLAKPKSQSSELQSKKLKFNLKSTWAISLISLLLIIIDQLTKTLFMHKTYFENLWIYIKYSQNRGSALGIFSNIEIYNLLMIIISILVLILVFWKKSFFLKDNFHSILFVLFVSGLLGNFLDRVFFGFVRDFIAIKSLFIFNMADFYLTLLVILVIYNEFIAQKSNTKL